MPGCEPGGKGSTPFGYPFDLHECAPGRAGSLQNCSTGFDSSRSCSCPDGVADCTQPSEGCSPGSNPGRDTQQRGLRVCRSSHGSLRHCKTRFNSSAGCYEIYVLGVCRIRTRPCEGRRPGSIPGEDAFDAGARRYSLAPKHALAQIAATGCFNGTFYATGRSQLDELKKLIDQVDVNTFLAKLAVYARERAYMKDMAAAVVVVLVKCGTVLLERVFP